MLGSFGKFWDVVKVNEFQLKQFSKEELTDIYSSLHPNAKKSEIDGAINYAFEEQQFEDLNKKEVLIYGCPHCGDEGCGGIAIHVYKKANYYVWTDHKKLNFKFNKQQYKVTFQSYLDEHVFNQTS